jgi:hypothetical protein
VTPQVMKVDKESGGSVVKAIGLVLGLYRGHPLGLVRRQLVKTEVFLNGYEVPANLNYYIERRYVGLLAGPWVTWAWLLGPVVVGLWAVRRQWRRWFELYAYLLLMSLGTIAFFIVGRFRAPLVPPLAVFAGAGAAWTWELARSRKWTAAAGAVIAAAAVIALCWPRAADPLRANDYHNMVRYYMLKQEPDQARRWVEEGKERTRERIGKHDSADARYYMARLDFLAGDPLGEVEAEIAKAEQEAPPEWLAPQLAALSGEIEERRSSGDPRPGGFRFLGAREAGEAHN